MTEHTHDEHVVNQSIMPDENSGRAVTVKWTDSGTAIPGWTHHTKLPTSVTTVESIGFWVGSNDVVIAIAGTKDDLNEAWLNCQIIQKSAIEEMTWA